MSVKRSRSSSCSDTESRMSSPTVDIKESDCELKAQPAEQVDRPRGKKRDSR